MGTVKGLCSGTGALLRGSLWKANILFKKKAGCCLAAPEPLVCEFPGAFSYWS